MDYDFYVNVDGSADFSSIQDAIDAALPGNTIFVYSGRYTENIVIDKTIILNGENKDTTIINSSANKNVINVTADNVEFSGFTVEICGGYSIHSGIDIQANNTHIFDNKLTIRDIYYYPNGMYITSNRMNNNIHDNSFLKTGLGILLFILFDVIYIPLG
jgi:nitrous oxidase accessory protein NosD